jgi:phosphatidylinositol kinase/protein kinase (PI-3  family)
MKSNENEIASEVLENCRLFLKGIDVEDKHEKSVSEQVQKLISNAADKTLLSRMFEGWCPWI